MYVEGTGPGAVFEPTEPSQAPPMIDGPEMIEGGAMAEAAQWFDHRAANSRVMGVSPVLWDPLAPRRGPLASSPDRKSAIGWVGNASRLLH
jgi:hypothetical protein